MSMWFDSSDWAIHDNRTTETVANDSVSSISGVVQYGFRYIRDTVRPQSNDVIPIQEPLFNKYNKNNDCHGLVVFFHGYNSTPWEWRYAVRQFMDHYSFHNYKFWVPLIRESRNTSIYDIAKGLAVTVNQFILDNPESTIFFIGTSSGSEISALVHHYLDDDFCLDIKLRVVNIAGQFGTSEIAKYAKSLGLLQYVGSYINAESLTEDYIHEDLLDTWNAKIAGWHNLQIDMKFMFYGIDSSNFPKLNDYANSTVELVRGQSSYGIIDDLADQCLYWCYFQIQ